MENKYVGFLIIGISVLFIVVILLYQSALRELVAASCVGEHALNCPMYDSVNKQTYLALSIVGILIIFGGVLIFSKPKEKVIVKKMKEKKKKIDIEGLESKEREVIKILQKENGTIFQAELMEKLGVGKVGITRLLDKLEAKQLIERKRRGMNNIVVLRG